MIRFVSSKSTTLLSISIAILSFYAVSYLNGRQGNQSMPDAENLINQNSINDCPYIFHEEGRIIIRWIESGNIVEKICYNDDFKNLQINTCEVFEAEYISTNLSLVPNNQQHFLGASKIVALSDIHGQFDLFIKLLQAHKIIDQQKNWSFEDGHFVITGDVFDRGDKVTETLWFLYKLEQQAARAGGKLHLLLGNHEVMVLNGSIKYVNDKYIQVAEKMGMAHKELFGPTTLLGQWLRTKPIAVSVNNIAFTHGGFSPEFVAKGYNILTTNQLFHDGIIDHLKDSIAMDSSLYFLSKSDGPIWYRGYFRDENFTKKYAQNILNKMEVKHIVVGHTSMEEVMSHFDGLIFSVDSSIKNGESGEILIWENNRFFRGTILGKRMEL